MCNVNCEFLRIFMDQSISVVDFLSINLILDNIWYIFYLLSRILIDCLSFKSPDNICICVSDTNIFILWDICSQKHFLQLLQWEEGIHWIKHYRIAPFWEKKCEKKNLKGIKDDKYVCVYMLSIQPCTFLYEVRKPLSCPKNFKLMYI